MTHVLQWTIWAIVMALVMAWLARTRDRAPDRSTDGLVLRMPKSILLVGGGCALLFFGTAVAAFLTADDGRGPLYLAIFSGFGLLGVPIVADYFFDRFELEEACLRYRTTLGGEGVAPWEDIVEARYSESAKWFRLRLRNGRVVRASAMLIGLPQLASYLLARGRNLQLSEADRKLLERTAAGHPPSIWG